MMQNGEKNIVPEGMMSGPLQMSRRDVQDIGNLGQQIDSTSPIGTGDSYYLSLLSETFT